MDKVFPCTGASNHSDVEREEHDYYATPPYAVRLLLDVEKFKTKVWECACGGGHIAEEFKKAGYDVMATDLYDHGYGRTGVDFLKASPDCTDTDIVTNPPYRYASAFARHALDILPDGGKLAMFLKLTFLEGKERRTLFDVSPFRTLYVSTSRIKCAMNGVFGNNDASAVAYGWYVWEKGFKGEPVIRWIN